MAVAEREPSLVMITRRLDGCLLPPCNDVLPLGGGGVVGGGDVGRGEGGGVKGGQEVGHD